MRRSQKVQQKVQHNLQSIRRAAKLQFFSEQRQYLVRQLQERCHLSFKINDLINKLPDSLEELYFLFEARVVPLLVQKIKPICCKMASMKQNWQQILRFINKILQHCQSSDEIRVVTTESLDILLKKKWQGKKQIEVTIEYFQLTHSQILKSNPKMNILILIQKILKIWSLVEEIAEIFKFCKFIQLLLEDKSQLLQVHRRIITIKQQLLPRIIQTLISKMDLLNRHENKPAIKICAEFCLDFMLQINLNQYWWKGIIVEKMKFFLKYQQSSIVTIPVAYLYRYFLLQTKETRIFLKESFKFNCLLIDSKTIHPKVRRQICILFIENICTPEQSWRSMLMLLRQKSVSLCLIILLYVLPYIQTEYELDRIIMTLKLLYQYHHEKGLKQVILSKKRIFQRLMLYSEEYRRKITTFLEDILDQNYLGCLNEKRQYVGRFRKPMNHIFTNTGFYL